MSPRRAATRAAIPKAAFCKTLLLHGRTSRSMRGSWARRWLRRTSAVFFLPGLGAIAHGFPAWDMAVFGVAGHGNPLFYSALAPIALAGLLYSVSRARGLLAGFAVGVAAHLLVVFAANLVDIRYVP